jgi:hypothetical protein
MMNRKLLMTLPFIAVLSACQTAQTGAHEPGAAMAAVQKEAEAEGRAFGAAQGAVGLVGAFDPTGLSSLPVMAAGRVAHKSWMTSTQARMKAAQQADLQAMYKKYGMNPDGTPSGVSGPDSKVP